MEKLLLKAEIWAERWATLLLRPRRAFASPQRRQLKTFEFYFINVFATYIAIVLTCLAYFASEHRDTFAVRVREGGVALLTVATGTFVLFLAVSFFALLLGCVGSYAAYERAGSMAKFSEHLRAHMELTFLDPIGAVAVTLLALLTPVSVVNPHITWFNA